MSTKATLAAVAALSLSACASTGNYTDAKPPQGTAQTPAIITVQSEHSFDDTRRRIKDILREEKFNIFESIDHAAGARKAGLTLSPSTLYIFGNPKGGTPLMQAEPRLGAALPLKMHVYQSEGRVMLSYTDISATAQSYGLDPMMLPVPKIAAKLDMVAEKITGR